MTIASCLVCNSCDRASYPQRITGSMNLPGVPVGWRVVEKDASDMEARHYCERCQQRGDDDAMEREFAIHQEIVARRA